MALNRQLKVSRIRLRVIIIFVLTGFALIWIRAWVLNAIETYNNRLVDRWLSKVAEVSVGMTVDDVFSIFGKPVIRSEHTDGAVIEVTGGGVALRIHRFDNANGMSRLIIPSPYDGGRKKKKAGELVESIFSVELTNDVVTGVGMGYR